MQNINAPNIKEKSMKGINSRDDFNVNADVLTVGQFFRLQRILFGVLIIALVLLIVACSPSGVGVSNAIIQDSDLPDQFTLEMSAKGNAVFGEVSSETTSFLNEYLEDASFARFTIDTPFQILDSYVHQWKEPYQATNYFTVKVDRINLDELAAQSDLLETDYPDIGDDSFLVETRVDGPADSITTIWIMWSYKSYDCEIKLIAVGEPFVDPLELARVVQSRLEQIEGLK